MHVDESTLLLFSALTALITAAMFYGLARAIDGVSGLRWWSAGYSCLALGFASDVVPSSDGRLGSLLFNLPIAFGHLLMLVGTLQFTERPRPRAPLALLAALTIVDPIVFAFVLPSTSVRILAVAVVDAVVRLWTAWAFLGHRGPEARLGYRIAGAVTLLEALGGFLRAALAIAAPQTVTYRAAPSSFNALSWGGMALDSVVWGQTVILLVALRLIAAIREAAHHDPLTHCLNRRGLRLTLEAPLAAALAARDPVAVLMCDVDHFKQVNDRHGHAVGDEVLEALGRVLRAVENDCTFAARWGGEEFIFVARGLSEAAALALAERVRSRFAAESASIGALGGCTLSVGIAQHRLTPGLDLRAIRAAADEALYAAKRGGRDRVEVAPVPPPELAGALAPA